MAETTQTRRDGVVPAQGATVETITPPMVSSESMSTTVAWLVRAAPYIVAGLLLILGYVHYAPGTAHDESPLAYRTWSFPAFQYSDLIWLYLRDDLASHPIPYLDYELEYPVLTGLLSYLLSLAPSIELNFALTYLVLAASGLGTIAALRRIPGANPWYYAAIPALLFYTGYQWDPAAVFVTALALVAYARGNDRLGTVGMTAAVWFKLFPIVWIGAAIVDRLRERRYRDAAEIGAIFAVVSLALNLPVALASWDGWTYFFEWNRTRPADAGFWVYLDHLSTSGATSMSFLLTTLGALGLAAIALQSRRPVLIPLGAAVLIWWLMVNKTFTTHLVLWVFLAIALMRPPVAVWLGLVALDVFAFQLGNYLNVPIVDEFKGHLIIPMGWRYIYDPLQLIRVAAFLGIIVWTIDRFFIDGALVRWVNSLFRDPAPVESARSLRATAAPGDGWGAHAPNLILTGTVLLALALALPVVSLAKGLYDGERVRRIDFSAAVEVPLRQPAFGGSLPDGATRGAVQIRPAVPVRWTVQAGADGSFETTPPVNLPPGDFRIRVNDEPPTDLTIVAGQPRPTLRGTVASGAQEVRLTITPPVFLTWEVQSDEPGGDYETQVPVPLDPGLYSLMLDGQLIRRFVIMEDAT